MIIISEIDVDKYGYLYGLKIFVFICQTKYRAVVISNPYFMKNISMYTISEDNQCGGATLNI